MSRLSRCGLTLGLAAFLLVTAVGLVRCGGGGSPSSPPLSSTGTVTTTMTDPPTCRFSIDHVYATITKVTAHLNANAGPNDAGWQTLVDLTRSPKQIDLLSLQNTTCLLTQLGSTTLPTGTYQQIRLYLLSNQPAGNAATPSPNACSGTVGFNCVVPHGGSAQPLNLSSESQTGIKIPSSQITNGGLTVKAGQAVDLNINFNSCDSVVRQGNGQWRLKPVLLAGEVQTNNNAISGTVIDSLSKRPISGALVSLEVPDPGASNLDIVSTGTATDASGNFSFCPLTAGSSFDVVVTAMAGGVTPTTYNATVTLSVPVGTALGNIPMVPEPSIVRSTTVNSRPATLQGQVTTTTSSTGAQPIPSEDATSADITIAALQAAGTSKMVTIPSFSGSTIVATGASPTTNNAANPLPTTCPTGTACQNYVITVPASNPSVGTFAAGANISYSTPVANPALYWIRAVATIPSSGSAPATPDCSPSSFPASFMAGVQPTGNQVGVDPPPLADTTVTQNFGFAGCASGF